MDRSKEAVDKTPHNVASDQGLHWLVLILQFLDIVIGSNMDMFKLTLLMLNKLKCHAHF